MDGLDRFHGKAGAVLGAAAVFIGAVIEDGRAEAAAHPVAVHLHHVEPGLLCQHRRLAEQHQLRDRAAARARKHQIGGAEKQPHFFAGGQQQQRKLRIPVGLARLLQLIRPRQMKHLKAAGIQTPQRLRRNPVEDARPLAAAENQHRRQIRLQARIERPVQSGDRLLFGDSGFRLQLGADRHSGHNGALRLGISAVHRRKCGRQYLRLSAQQPVRLADPGIAVMQETGNPPQPGGKNRRE